jgi:RNA polymerase sigma-70 factor (ECF subfamily)
VIGESFGEVLAAARTGASWALEALYVELQPRVLRYLQARAAWEAEDLAHEVWLDVAGALARFEGDESAFSGWVFTIAHRRVVDLHRRSARRKTRNVGDEALPDRPSGDDVEEAVVGSIQMSELIRLVRALPGDQADVILMRVVAGLDVDEVARVLGKRPGTVRVVAHRALKRLAAQLPALGFDAAPRDVAARGVTPAAPVTEEGIERLKGRDAS